LFCFTASVLAGLGGLAQINPIWLYGPYRPAAVSAGSQPDWYIGWLDGALRVMPPLEVRAFHHTIPNPFFPGVLLPGITFTLLYAWPFLEAHFSKDRDPHNLLDRPRDRPLRSAFGVSTLTFYTVLFLAAGTDVLAATFGLSFQSLLHVFQVSLLVAPPLLGWLTWRILKDLSRQHAHPIQQPVGGRIMRTPSGGYQVEEAVDGHPTDDDAEPAGAAADRASTPT
jgi:ubiquinol-cytochrome c reductase cytochrome b subunit